MAVRHYQAKKPLFVLLCLGFLAILLAHAASATRSGENEEHDLDRDDDFEAPEVDTSREPQAEPRQVIEARQRQSRLLENTVQSPSLSEQIANLAQMLPLADSLRLNQRILRLGALSNHVLEILHKQGMEPPVNKLVLFLLFVVGSYLPALVATLFYNAFVKQPQPPRFDPALHIYNKPDAMEIAKILQTVTQIQASLSQGIGRSGASEQTDGILTQT